MRGRRRRIGSRTAFSCAVGALAVAVGALAVAACAPGMATPGMATPSSAAALLPPSSTTPSPTPPSAVRSRPPAPSWVASLGFAARPDSVVAFDPASGEHVASVDVGRDPLVTAVAAGRIWSLDLGDGALSVIDPSDLTRRRVRVSGDAVGLAGGGDTAWVTAHDRHLLALDGRSGEVQRSLALADERLFRRRDAGFVAVDGTTAWVTVPVLGQPSAPHTLWRVDTVAGVVVERHALGRDPLTPVVGLGSVWVPSRGGRELVRVDIASGRRTAHHIVDDPAAIAIGDGALWIGLGRTRAVIRLDPAALDEVARIPVASEIRAIAFVAGELWVTSERAVEVIDPRTNAVRLRLPFANPTNDLGPTAIAEADGRVWISVE